MITHAKVVAGQGIERINQLRCLGNGEITGIRHPRVLALQESLPGPFV
jgi:hypothetical protein